MVRLGLSLSSPRRTPHLNLALHSAEHRVQEIDSLCGLLSFVRLFVAALGAECLQCRQKQGPGELRSCSVRSSPGFSKAFQLALRVHSQERERAGIGHNLIHTQPRLEELYVSSLRATLFTHIVVSAIMRESIAGPAGRSCSIAA